MALKPGPAVSHVASEGQEQVETEHYGAHAGPHRRPELAVQHDRHCRQGMTVANQARAAAALCHGSLPKFEPAPHWPCLFGGPLLCETG
jgi:hypothetical protein